MPHSWPFYFLTKIGHGFIKWGTDHISYKMGGRFGADPPHFIGPVRRGILKGGVLRHRISKKSEKQFFDAQTAILKELRAVEGATS